MKICVEKLLSEKGWLCNQVVEVEEERITSIRPATESECASLSAGYLVPGYIDTQVNGGGGVLLNQMPTPEGVGKIAQAHLAFGTTGMLPTVITDHADVMANAADAIADVLCSESSTVLGIHFEGPFLNSTKKGVHDQRFIRVPSEQELAILSRKDIGQVLVTLAPDKVDSGLIKELVQEGILVSLGHTDATSTQTKQALAAGATGFTHLYNAMSPLTSREPGAVGTALLDKQSYAGLIVDHHHLHPDSARLAINTKGANRIMLVTDAMAHTGCDIQRLAFFDTEIIKTENKLTTPEGTLAGSCLDMHSAVINTHIDLGFSLEEAVVMASQTPAEFLGQGNEQGLLAAGKKANFLLLNQNLELQRIWLNGKLISADKSR